MPRASFSPRVEAYSLIWRARLAPATTSPYRESTLSRSSSIFRSFSIFASRYYALHNLYHVPACLLPFAVDDLAVELVAGRDLPDRRRQPGLQRLLRLGGPAREPAPRLFQRRGPDEDHDSVGALLAHLPRSLELYLQDHGPPLVQELLHLRLGRPVEVTRVFGPLKELFLLYPAFELLPGEEEVVPAVDLPLSRGAGRRRDGVSELRHHL